ncbi:MAG: class I SAM-dependent rRNA methyltransferase [Bacteroidetes bacterium]|nr:class I SAM-dependent rRNA methyltransferase [Bacteroidota bacterium]
MDRFHSIILKPGKEAAVLRRHPWIFSGAIDSRESNIKEGEIVEVFSSEGKYLATGHFLNGSIAVKIFSFLQTSAGFDFWLGRLKQAFELRKKAGLTDSESTSAYRLVFSEGDELPGLIIDWYNGVAVIQTHSPGMHNIKPLLVDVLKELYGEKLLAVYDKSAETMARSQGNRNEHRKEIRNENRNELHHNLRNELNHDHFLFGSTPPVEIAETSHKFNVDFINGQKTGFFLDQSSNRMFAQFYARNRSVLNTFCYSGAFSVYCLKGGARHVHSVDSSNQAIRWTKENMVLNGIDETFHSEEVADVKVFLREAAGRYSMIIVDPPAFAKTHQVTNNALHAYVHLNASAIRHLEPGGLLFTFSCSQAISREMFRSALQSAAIETGRNVKILHHLSQGPDHPVSIYHPEGEYLKGLILEVE